MEKKPLSHFERMKMMCTYFKEQTAVSDLYIPEYNASRAINEIIETESDRQIRAHKINVILQEVNQSEHANNVQWYDYCLHVNLYL